MNRAELIAACERCGGTESMRQIVREAIGHLQDGEPAISDTDSHPLPAEHYRGIYRRRLVHCRAIGHRVVGHAETTEAFEALPDGMPLKLVLVETKRAGLGLWIDPTGSVVGCVVTPPGPPAGGNE